MSEELTSAKRKRKASKPVMEKKRRARINQSLDELKALILDVTKRDVSRHSKLEKADILEMTVRHLKKVRSDHQIINNIQRDPLANFRAGFNECTDEVTRYLASLDDVGVDLKTRFLEHLATCCHASAAVPKPLFGVPCLPSMQRGVTPSSAPSVLSFVQRKQDGPSNGRSSHFQVLLVPTGSPFLMTASQPSGHQDLTHVLCKDPMETSSPGGIPKVPGSLGTDSTLWRPF